MILNRLLSNPVESNLSVDFATLEYAKRRKNVLRLSSASASLAAVVRDCALCSEKDACTDYEFLVQCDTPVTMHNICSESPSDYRGLIIVHLFGRWKFDQISRDYMREL